MPQSTKGLALNATSCLRCSRCSRIIRTELICLARRAVIPMLGRIDRTGAKEGEQRPEPSCSALSIGGCISCACGCEALGAAYGRICPDAREQVLRRAAVTKLYQNPI